MTITKALLPFAVIIGLGSAIGLAINHASHGSPAPDASVTPCQVAGCRCGCAEGGPCNCDEPSAHQEMLDAELALSREIAETLRSLDARLDALESPQAVVVPPEPEPIAVVPERTADDIMEGLQEAFDEIVDPVDVPTTHDGNGYLLGSAIESWLASHGSGRSWSYSGGNYGAPLRNHLIRTHGWRESQLMGLNDSQLRELHSADHNGRLGPRSDVEVNIVMASASDEGVPVYYDSRDDYWHWNWNGRNYRWHTLEEGKTYGGRFVYHEGRMCWNGAECTTAPVVRSAPPVVRIGSSYGGCPGGNCPRPMRYGRRWR